MKYALRPLINLLMNMFAVCGFHAAFGLHPSLAETLNTQIVEQEPTGNIKRGQCQMSNSSEQILPCFHERVREMSALSLS